MHICSPLFVSCDPARPSCPTPRLKPIGMQRIVIQEDRYWPYRPQTDSPILCLHWIYVFEVWLHGYMCSCHACSNVLCRWIWFPGGLNGVIDMYIVTWANVLKFDYKWYRRSLGMRSSSCRNVNFISLCDFAAELQVGYFDYDHMRSTSRQNDPHLFSGSTSTLYNNECHTLCCGVYINSEIVPICSVF